MSIQQIREIIRRDGLAHIPYVSSYTKTRREGVYITEISEPKIVGGRVIDGRVIGFVFSDQRKNFKRPIDVKHDGRRFSVGSGSCGGKTGYVLANVDLVHVDYLYDVVSTEGVNINKARTACVSRQTFYGTDLNVVEATLLCRQVRRSGLSPNAWTSSVGEYQRASGKGPYWRPDWNETVKVTYDIQELVD